MPRLIRGATPMRDEIEAQGTTEGRRLRTIELVRAAIPALPHIWETDGRRFRIASARSVQRGDGHALVMRVSVEDIAGGQILFRDDVEMWNRMPVLVPDGTTETVRLYKRPLNGHPIVRERVWLSRREFNALSQVERATYEQQAETYERNNMREDVLAALEREVAHTVSAATAQFTREHVR